ncbi:MAG: hypothetical protein EBU07_17315 [Betaproteobacteria bacterium]|nr:hypothetical protein [Betaproteobacteria bacterium]
MPGFDAIANILLYPDNAGMPRYTTTVAKRLRTMMTELQELRRIRGEYERLVGTLQELGISGGQSLRQSARLVSAGARNGGGKRYRSSPAEMETQYKALASACGSAWMSRDAICQKAGLDPKRCAAAFKRLTEGYEADGKKVKALLESNGKRGLGGAYRKA